MQYLYWQKIHNIISDIDFDHVKRESWKINSDASKKMQML